MPARRLRPAISTLATGIVPIGASRGLPLALVAGRLPYGAVVGAVLLTVSPRAGPGYLPVLGSASAPDVRRLLCASARQHVALAMLLRTLAAAPRGDRAVAAQCRSVSLRPARTSAASAHLEASRRTDGGRARTHFGRPSRALTALRPASGARGAERPTKRRRRAKERRGFSSCASGLGHAGADVRLGGRKSAGVIAQQGEGLAHIHAENSASLPLACSITTRLRQVDAAALPQRPAPDRAGCFGDRDRAPGRHERLRPRHRPRPGAPRQPRCLHLTPEHSDLVTQPNTLRHGPPSLGTPWRHFGGAPQSSHQNLSWLGGGAQMKKITIRKAGPVRLTSAACSSYPTRF
jgi:hypothetical protein